MTPINLNSIHHVTEEQYQEATEYILHGHINANKTPSAVSRFERRWRDAKVRVMENGPRLFFGNKPVVPITEIEVVLSKLYDEPTTGGDLGRDKFYSRVNSLFVGISRADVEKFVQNDETHQLHRRVTKKDEGCSTTFDIKGS
jgi:hypothetical protein